MRYLKATFLIMLLILLLAFYSVVTEATARIEPARIIINSHQNSRSTGVIEVINTGTEEVKLTALLNDWALDENDKLVFYEAGKMDSTLVGLIKFNPKKFSLSPGKTQIVRFTINTPENTSQEKRGVVFFERETDYMEVATGSKIKTQVGTVIYLVPDKIKYNFKLLGLQIYNSLAPAAQGIVLKIENAGAGHMRYYPAYKIIDSASKLVMEEDFGEYIILPGAKRNFSFILPERLKKGEYKLLLNIKFYNNQQTADYQIPIKIK